MIWGENHLFSETPILECCVRSQSLVVFCCHLHHMKEAHSEGVLVAPVHTRPRLYHPIVDTTPRQVHWMPGAKGLCLNDTLAWDFLFSFISNLLRTSFLVYLLYDFSLKLSQTHQTISFPPETPSLHVTIWEDRSIVPQPQQTAKPFFLLGTLSLEKVGLPVKWLHHFFHSKTTKITKPLRKNRTGNLQNGELVHLPWVKWMRFEMYQDSNLYCVGERIFLHPEDAHMEFWSICSKSTGDPTKM